MTGSQSARDAIVRNNVLQGHHPSGNRWTLLLSRLTSAKGDRQPVLSEVLAASTTQAPRTPGFAWDVAAITTTTSLSSAVDRQPVISQATAVVQ
jgi:hypothetical protein